MDTAQASAGLRPVVGDSHEVEFTDLIAKTGQAVGRIGGMVVFVLGPLAGERATIRITLVKSNYSVGELLEITQPSPARVEPFCELFGRCGGCQVQHLAYHAQLIWKRTLIVEALARIGGISDPSVAATRGMDEPRAYRNKMSLVVSEKDSERRFGFYAAGTHDVVPVHACPIVAPRLDRYIEELWDITADPSHAQAFVGARHLVARVGQASGEGVLSITTPTASPALDVLAEPLLERLAGLIGVTNAFDTANENAVMGRRHRTVSGRAEMEEVIGDVKFRVSAASFFQVNTQMVGEIFETLRPRISANTAIVDLYCGAGTFSLFFARCGARVVGIEENYHAVREARDNAELNHLADCTDFIGGRVDRVLQSSAGQKALREAQVVFLDPPRKGSDEITLTALARAKIPHIWYLSCNPATLARDIALLARSGYVLEEVQPFDMFPQTGHVEALAYLRYETKRP